MANTVCIDTRPCFGKRTVPGAKYGACRILSDSSEYADGECPFCKPRATETNGVEYPYDRNYAGSKKESA